MRVVRREGTWVSNTEARTEKTEDTRWEGGGEGREGSKCWNTPGVGEDSEGWSPRVTLVDVYHQNYSLIYGILWLKRQATKMMFQTTKLYSNTEILKF